MYTKILLIVIIFILSAFFYLHAQNPGTITFVITREYTYTLPIALLLFFGFFSGAVLAVLNSLLVDAKRAIKDLRLRRDKKLAAQSDENYKKGLEALYKGDIQEARSLIEKANAARPGDAGVVIALSETFVRERRHKEALKALENGFINNPDSVPIVMAMARVSEDCGDGFRAAGAYSEVLKLDPKNPYALKRLRDFKMNEKSWEDASNLQKTIYDSEKDDQKKKREKALLAGLLFESAASKLEGNDLSGAMMKVKDVLKCDHAFMPAHMLLGESLARQGNHSNAVKVWEKARQKYSNSEPILIRLEDMYIKDSAPERILERYKKEIISKPTDGRLRLLLSRLYLRLEMVDAAIEELERLHQEGEESYYSQILLGEAYIRRKQGGKAAHLLQKAIGMDREFLPPFACSNCGTLHKTWSPRCPSCGTWNTLAMSTSGNENGAGGKALHQSSGSQKIVLVR